MSRIEAKAVWLVIVAGLIATACGFYLLIGGAIRADNCREAGGVMIQGHCSRVAEIELVTP